uniref:Uncharacterized protein n=1 Tax=Ciona savignyi TaxID=51511 RepID=H2YC41_CIOSA
RSKILYHARIQGLFVVLTGLGETRITEKATSGQLSRSGAVAAKRPVGHWSCNGTAAREPIIASAIKALTTSWCSTADLPASNTRARNATVAENTRSSGALGGSALNARITICARPATWQIIMTKIIAFGDTR